MRGKSIKVNAVLSIVKKCTNIIVPLMIYPYISRVLGVQIYGKYAFAESIMGYVSLVSGFGISTYAIREIAKVRDNKAKVNQTASEILTFNVITMLTSFLCLIITMLFIDRVRELKLMFIIMMFDIAFSTLSRDWLNEAYEDYIYITIRYILFQLLSVGLIFLFVKKSNDVIMYVFCRCIATSGGYIVSIFYTIKYASFHFSAFKSLKKHLRPLLVLFGCSCASVIYIHSDITILGFFKDDTEVGIYSIATKIYTLIKSVINAMVLVMIPRAAYYVGCNEDNQYSRMISSAGNILILIIPPVAIGIYCLSSDLILVLAGHEYVRGTDSLKILTMSLFFAVFSYLYAYGCLIPNGMEQYFLKASIVSAAFNIAANIIFIPLIGINAAAVTTLLAEIIMYSITRRFTREVCIAQNKKNVLISGISIIDCIIIYIGSIFIKQYFEKSITRILVMFMIGIIGYLLVFTIYSFIRKENILEVLKNVQNK